MIFFISIFFLFYVFLLQVLTLWATIPVLAAFALFLSLTRSSHCWKRINLEGSGVLDHLHYQEELHHNAGNNQCLINHLISQVYIRHHYVNNKTGSYVKLVQRWYINIKKISNISHNNKKGLKTHSGNTVK